MQFHILINEDLIGIYAHSYIHQPSPPRSLYITPSYSNITLRQFFFFLNILNIYLCVDFTSFFYSTSFLGFFLWPDQMSSVDLFVAVRSKKNDSSSAIDLTLFVNNSNDVF